MIVSEKSMGSKTWEHCPREQPALKSALDALVNPLKIALVSKSGFR